MDMIFSDMTFWHWVAFGTILIILEIFVPSAILLWPGIAAVFTGVVKLAFPMIELPLLFLIWGVSSLILIVGWQMYKKSKGGLLPPSTINRRGEQIVGRHFTLAHDIVNGAGELHIDDTRWKVVSHKDFSVGVKVRVVAVEGTSLRVEEYIG